MQERPFLGGRGRGEVGRAMQDWLVLVVVLARATGGRYLKPTDPP